MRAIFKTDYDQDVRLFNTRGLFVNFTPDRFHKRIIPKQWIRLMRNGKDVTAGSTTHPEDRSREDLVALDPSESVIIYRGFRDFVGPYVAHCHNLAHEDHAMMFAWEITP